MLDSKLGLRPSLRLHERVRVCAALRVCGPVSTQSNADGAQRAPSAFVNEEEARVSGSRGHRPD
jgi:hypothetical protein